jgi:hypothetical protein
MRRMNRLRELPLFPFVPIVPALLVGGTFVLSILSFARLRRLSRSLALQTGGPQLALK